MSPIQSSRGQLLTSVQFLMASGLILGTATAVAHHAFATRVNGRPVQSSEQQEWYSSIGIGLAFLTRAFLSASAGLAYTQLLWYILRSRTFTLAGVDATFSVVKDLWSFFNWELWSNGLSLVIMAIVVWAIPIMAIFTPGTLTVQLSSQPNSTIIQRSISSLNYSAVRQFGQMIDIHGGYGYIGPSSEISRLMATVAAQGFVLNPPGPYTNCSYRLEFYGPSLSCGSAISINSTKVAEIIISQGKKDPRPFVSFVPMWGIDNNETDPGLAGLRYVLDGGSATAWGSTFDIASEDHGRIYVVVNEELGGSFGRPANKTIECGLYNTSYSLAFAFSNGQPKLTIVDATRLNSVAGIDVLEGCDSTISEKRYEAPLCSPERVAYTAVLSAFSQQLIGYLAQSRYGYIWSAQTQVAKTVFMDTKELYASQYYMNHGKHPETRPADAIGMVRALEEVFTNGTLSLFSRTSFLQNETSAAIVPVTVLTPQNDFIYRPRNLLISYISGVTATAMCVVVGFVCISKASSEAFGTSFSTIMRTTRNPDLDRLLPPAETSGAEPLSKELATIKLRLLRGKNPLLHAQGEMGGDVDTETTSDDEWSCFAILEDGNDLETAPSGAMSRKAKSPASDIDVDSLLMPGET